MKKDSIFYTVAFSFVVSFLFVFLLAMANEGTSDIVKRNQEIARQKAILLSMGIPFKTESEVQSLFKSIEVLRKEGVQLYRSSQGGKPIYAKEWSGSGLWGTIRGVLSVDEEVSQIVGIQIVDHNETPGLGGRIADSWWKDQFRGLKVKNGKISITYGAEAGGGKANKEAGIVDGVTGASRTSQAMDSIVNSELAALKKLLGGSK